MFSPWGITSVQFYDPTNIFFSFSVGIVVVKQGDFFIVLMELLRYAEVYVDIIKMRFRYFLIGMLGNATGYQHLVLDVERNEMWKYFHLLHSLLIQHDFNLSFIFYQFTI